ncbi:hypothetical protein TrVE_jg11736 [Triparma verrucosa]|uniref:Uncharacterized protein n=1 Tax=Triparma verrucosa TaxID=1606542 RepID=A0A9W7CLX0_9STRA|nr:hypothetical protein TrVE_jg11736 [Triparma verrucosa]
MGGDDEEEAFEGSESDSAADKTPVTGGADFMHTDDFRRLFVGIVMVDTLVAMRWLDRKWHKVVEKKLIELEDEPFGEIIVHGGNDISAVEAYSAARKKRMQQVTKVVFLLNITKVGDTACAWASNLVVVDIPEGITTISGASFYDCSSLKEINYAFNECSKLVPSDIHVSDNNAVVAYLRSIQNSTPNMSMFWSIAVVLFALIAQFAFMNK